jgi:hydroxylamine oxidation protein HaoB
VDWSLKKGLLLLLCGALLLSGSAMLFHQVRAAFVEGTEDTQTNSDLLSVKLLQGQASDLQGAFSVESVDSYTIQRDGKEAFSLLLAHYQDGQNQQHRAVLFPKSKEASSAIPNPTGLRQSIWQEAASAISQNTAKDALIISWWDDGQRTHFLSGREAWVNKPAEQTFVSPVWKYLQDNLLLATEPESENLSTLARWLTMDSGKALAEMRQKFGTSRPIYLLVTNDLLMRVGELVDYGGAPIRLISRSFQAHDNLHGDIAQIKQWATEGGNSNYLAQKEGLNYRVWATAKGSETEKNSLLLRLLPFVDSLKKLPEGVKPVYQSHWGGYLSIYKVDF